MFRLWITTLGGAGPDRARRRVRRFVPSLSGSASYLEDRVVLSGGGHHAATLAQRAQVLEGTHAGQVVTNLYQSILTTNPTDAQLVKGVREVRHGHVAALRNSLLKTVRHEHGPVVTTTAVVTVSRLGSPTPTPLGSFTTITRTPAGTPVAVANRQLASAVVQDFRNFSLNLTSLAPVGPLTLIVATSRTFTRTGTAVTGETLSITSTIGNAAGTRTFTSGVTVSRPTTTTTTPTTTTTTTPTSATATNAALVQALLFALQGVATPVTATTPANNTSITAGLSTPLSQVALSQLPISPLSFTPIRTVNSPINGSPIGQVTMLSTTVINSPINASPIASPIPVIGPPIINSPINASPVASSIVFF